MCLRIHSLSSQVATILLRIAATQSTSRTLTAAPSAYIACSIIFAMWRPRFLAPMRVCLLLPLSCIHLQTASRLVQPAVLAVLSISVGAVNFARKCMYEKLIKCAAKTGFGIQIHIPRTHEMKNRLLSKNKGCLFFLLPKIYQLPEYYIPVA